MGKGGGEVGVEMVEGRLEVVGGGVGMGVGVKGVDGLGEEMGKVLGD